MQWQFEYTALIWPSLGTASVCLALFFYSWRHRRVPGATAFAFYLVAAAAWCLFDALQLAGADFSTKLIWAKFAGSTKMLLPVTGFCFALDYAGLGKWITRRTVALLALPLLVLILLTLTNDAHRLMWATVEFGERLDLGRGPVFWLGLLYSYLLYVLATLVFVWLFIRSPLYRWPVAVILVGQLVPRVAFLVDVLATHPFSPLDPALIFGNVTAIAYAIALFRLHFFDVVPVARETVLERMTDGMLVLDARGRIADLNPAAQALLGAPRSQILGRDCAEALALFPALAELARRPAPAQSEIAFGLPSGQQWHQVSSSPLANQRGFHVGSLIVLHDITPLRQAHERLVEQERAIAALRERERLARDLHDSIGQVLAYVSLQVDASLKLLDDGKTAVATGQLQRLASISRDAHADVREFILDLRASPAEQRAFLPALRGYLEGFSQNYGIAAKLVPPDDVDESALALASQAQIFRIIQEALSNARKHGSARSVTVTIERKDNLARIAIEDDGDGFDPCAVESGFGLRFMRERAAEIGGRLDVQSAPGKGTSVVVAVPLASPVEA